MTKFIYFLTVFALTYSVMSQSINFITPDYQQIKLRIEDKESMFYYPPLFERYVKNDTTITEEEMHYLYFGYTFQKNYSPYYRHSLLKDFVEYFKKENINEADIRTIISMGNTILKDDPFNIRVMTLLGYTYYKKGDMDMAKVIWRKNAFVMNAILSSGDGESDSTAYYVINTADEYHIIRKMEATFGQQGLSPYKDQMIDVMSITDKNGDEKTLHFNVTRLFELNNK
mgnify:FL=1